MVFPSRSAGIAAKNGFYQEIGIAVGNIALQSELDAVAVRDYVESRLRMIQEAAAKPDVRSHLEQRQLPESPCS